MSILAKPFYLIRHAQTTSNVKSVACGLTDAKLTPEGIHCMLEIEKCFTPHLDKTAVIYHSSLTRSYETARLLKEKRPITLKQVSGLEEQNFGEWEGRAWDEVISELKKNAQPPNGESREQYTERVLKTLSALLISHQHSSPPIVVAHGGTFFALGYAYGYEIRDIPNGYIGYLKPRNNICDHSLPWDVYRFDTKDKDLKIDNPYFKL